jgi:quercetin dioxygenase-like cupin family protein
MKLAELYSELEFDERKPLIKVLFETSFTKEIRIAMQKGTVMKEHKTSFPIVVEIVAGAIDFGVNNDILHLKKGSLVALESNVPHDLKAMEASVVRLTLTKNDKTSRVDKVSEQ